MPKPLRVIYADDDPERLAVVSKLLIDNGLSTMAFPDSNANTNGVHAETPHVVLICERLFDELRGLAAAIWPTATIVVLAECENISQLPAKLTALAD
jgi:CheY-like chemotaxis protein